MPIINFIIKFIIFKIIILLLFILFCYYYIIIIILLWKHSCKISGIACNTAMTTDVVWRNGSVLVSSIEVNLHRARLVLGWVIVFRSNSGAGHLSRYVFSYPGQLSLAVLSWESAVSTSKMAVTALRLGSKGW